MLTCPCPTDHSDFFCAIHFEVQILQHQVGALSISGRVIDEFDLSVLRPIGIRSYILHPLVLLFVLTVFDDTLDTDRVRLEHAHQANGHRKVGGDRDGVSDQQAGITAVRCFLLQDRLHTDHQQNEAGQEGEVEVEPAITLQVIPKCSIVYVDFGPGLLLKLVRFPVSSDS